MEYKSLKRRLADLGKNPNNVDEVIEYLLEQRKMEVKKMKTRMKNEINLKDDHIFRLQRHIETMNRELLPVEKRYLEVVDKDVSNSKITINPCTGRVTLKISLKSSERVRNDSIEMAKIILNDDTFEPVTMRGRIEFKENKYIIDMCSESKKFRKYYEHTPS